MSVLLGREVSELAWFGAKLPTCFGGLGRGFAAQAPHPEIAAALAAKTLCSYRESLLIRMPE